jgi:hypothetical protein
MNELKTSTCTLQLAKIPFNFEDNYILEGGTSALNYLASKSGFTFSKVQFSKFENKMKYVLRLSDNYNAQFNQISMSDSYNSDSTYLKLFNYAIFVVTSTYKKANTTDETSTGAFLYFVNGVKWKSPQTIELDLKMDVLNTLYIANQLGYSTTNYSHIFDFGNKSNITRYHKARVQLPHTHDITKRVPLIDKLSEGIQAPLYKTNDKIFMTNNEDATAFNYYLVYKNSLDDSSDTNNIVDCYLTYGNLGNPLSKNVLLSGVARIFTPQMVGNNWFYLVAPFTFSLYDEITMQQVNLTISPTDVFMEISKTGDKLRVLTAKANFESTTTQIYITNQIEFNANVTYYYSSSMVARPINNVNQITILPNTTLDNTDRVALWNDINQLNRTDSKIIKVIKLPYPPTTDIAYNVRFTFNSSIWQYDENTKMLKLMDLNTRFKYQVASGSDNWVDFKTNGFMDKNSKSPTASRSIDNEYKLYHSDFRYVKLNYDSFNLILYNELLNTQYYDGAIIIVFFATTTINSRFIFQLNTGFGLYDTSYTDYADTLTISRNNELGLYNSSYINYIRNGFNYDVKNKNRSVAVQYGLGAVQILGAVGSALSSTTTGGIGIAGAISLGTSAIATLTHAVNSQISQETQIQQKLESLKAQANEIESSDDVDLLDVYNKNKLHAIKYCISNDMRQLLFNLFHYTGYKANSIDNITNYINTRYWFNFIQCDLHLINISKQIPIDIIEEFKAKFREGVTIFHRHANITNVSVDSGYNLKQDLENWDVDLVDES